jgi:hypothetical protein
VLSIMQVRVWDAYDLVFLAAVREACVGRVDPWSWAQARWRVSDRSVVGRECWVSGCLWGWGVGFGWRRWFWRLFSHGI